MRFSRSHTDIQSLAHRIRSGELEVYSVPQSERRAPKRWRQDFIAYILRGWDTTEFCVAKDAETGKEWVVKGGRRTSAILDFLKGSLTLDGQVEWLGAVTRPHRRIVYDDLPEPWRTKFKTYHIPILVASDFRDGELGEFLSFYQPISNDSSKREDLGVVAVQIRDVVERCDPRKTVRGLVTTLRRREEFIELLARALIVLERRDLAARITSRDVSRCLIREQPADKAAIEMLAGTLLLLGQTSDVASAALRNLSRATFLSWLLFLVRAQRLRLEPRTPKELGEFIAHFESCREKAIAEPKFDAVKPGGVASLQLLVRLYEIAASAPISAVPSLILRDAIIWIIYTDFRPTNGSELCLTREMQSMLQEAFSLSDKVRDGTKIAKRLAALGWARF